VAQSSVPVGMGGPSRLCPCGAAGRRRDDLSARREPDLGLPRACHGSIWRQLRPQQHRGQGGPFAAGRRRDLHRLPRQCLQHRRRGADSDGRPCGHRDSPRSPWVAEPGPDSPRPGGGCCRRRGVGCDPGDVQGVLQRQRDPEHDHAQPRRCPAHELPPCRPDGRPHGRQCHRRPDPPDPVALEARMAADHRLRDAAPPRRPDLCPRRRRRLLPALADELRLPRPCCRTLAGGRDLCGHARSEDDHGRDDPERRDVRPRGGDARLREHLASDGHRRQPDRVHRFGGVQRDRRRPVRRSQPALDDPVRLRVRGPARRRHRDAGRDQRPVGPDRRVERARCGLRRRARGADVAARQAEPATVSSEVPAAAGGAG
jgi:hypothetical protein